MNDTNASAFGKHWPAWLRPAPDSRVVALVERGKSPWAESVHFLWSAWVFITPLFGGQFNARWWLLTVLSYPLFMLLFAKVFLASRQHSQRYALALAGMGIALAPWYPSGVSYFIYGCVSCSFRRPLRFAQFLARLLLLNGVFTLVAWKSGYPWQVPVSVLVMTVIICTITYVEHIGHEKDAALRLSQDEVRRLAATAERERIGRDLHDLLGHTLSLITLKLELSRKLFDRDHAAARRELEEAERVARHALAEVRSAVTGIRAADLAAELASARLLLESSMVRLDAGRAPSSLPAEIERGLALVLREAATNIARHARATQARVSFETDGGVVRLRIEDDGRGGIAAHGNGLHGMRERARALGGALAIESPRGQGTRLCVELPLPAAEAAREPADPALAGDASATVPVGGWTSRERPAT